ncbi:hypothetical protein ACP70R_027382 [Stipagrostis hirtigluma subsp. patula]
MQKRLALVSAAAAVLGVAAAVLGFVAEGARSKALLGYDGRRCVYRRTAALGCGVAAALLVLAGMALVTAASGCFGRCDARGHGGRRRSSSAAANLSGVAWALAAAAAGLFLYGAWRNAGGTTGLSRGRRHGRVYYYGCADIRGGVFVTASIASIVGCACAIAAYVKLNRMTDEPAPGECAGAAGVVAVGQPQWSQPYPPPPVAYPPPPPYGGYVAKQPAGTARA